MFDLPFPALSVPFPAGVVPVTPHGTFDPTLPFILTLADRNPSAVMSGEARPHIVGHFATLAEGMRGAIAMIAAIAADLAAGGHHSRGL